MSSTIHQPNDKLFRLSMAELAVAKEFFAAHLPDNILNKVDLDSLELQNNTFIDDAYKTSEADVVYSVNINNSPAYLYLLCEHQTRVDRWLAFRLLVYTTRIMETHRKKYPKHPLPLVYSTVVYTGDESWNAPLEIFPLFGSVEELARETLLKPFQLLDIQRISDDDLCKQALSGLVAFVLKHRKTANFKQFLTRFMPWVHQIELHDPSGAFLGRIMLKYIIDRSSKGDKDLLVQEAQHYLTEELRGEIMTIAQQWEQEGIKKGLKEGMTIAQQWKQEGIKKGLKEGMTIAQQWKQEGIKKGLKEGMTIAQQWKEEGFQEGIKKGIAIAEQQWKEEGIQQGEATLLTRLLQHRFGELPSIYAQRIADAETQTLLAWGEKILDAKTLEEVFN